MVDEYLLSLGRGIEHKAQVAVQEGVLIFIEEALDLAERVLFAFDEDGSGLLAQSALKDVLAVLLI